MHVLSLLLGMDVLLLPLRLREANSRTRDKRSSGCLWPADLPVRISCSGLKRYLFSWLSDWAFVVFW